MSAALLEIRDLRVSADVGDGDGDGEKQILHGVSFDIARGEAVGVVGESGSGKSVTARAIIRLLPSNTTVTGEIRFDGESILDMDPAQLRAFRARRVAMIFQDPRAHTNPIHTIGDFLTEGLVNARRMPRREVTRRAIGVLREVGIADPERRMDQHPHELSGGLLQRVMIAAALMSDPDLLLADEPTTSLDVTTQEEVMAILGELRAERGLAMMFITHDLDLAAATTERLVVLKDGLVVEDLASDAVYEHAQADYTKELMSARIDFRHSIDLTERNDG